MDRRAAPIKKAPNKTPSAIRTSPILVQALWRVATPASVADFAPPWDQTASGLFAELVEGLAVSPEAAAEVAEVISEGYDACVWAFRSSAPRLYRTLVGIRALGVSAGVDHLAAAAGKTKTPGEPLVYEELAL